MGFGWIGKGFPLILFPGTGFRRDFRKGRIISLRNWKVPYSWGGKSPFPSFFPGKVGAG